MWHFRRRCLLGGIAETQSFVDGNKRTALIAMLTFRELNGCGLSVSDREAADWIISVSSGADPETVGDQFPRIEPVG
jgi:prophage maintenance system killer protein